MAGKFINRWNGPYQITKSYSKVNYEIENLQDKKQKRIIVHVNRIKKFNQREDDSTFPEQSIQPPQIINTDTHDNKDLPPTAVKRGRGRPRKIRHKLVNQLQATKIIKLRTLQLKSRTTETQDSWYGQKNMEIAGETKRIDSSHLREDG